MGTPTNVKDELSDQLPSNPLVVGGYSKDSDTAVGKVPDGWARGYRLHWLIDACGAVETLIVTAMDAADPVIAVELIERANVRGSIVRGDAAYDSNPLYQAVADAAALL